MSASPGHVRVDPLTGEILADALSKRVDEIDASLDATIAAFDAFTKTVLEQQSGKVNSRSAASGHYAWESLNPDQRRALMEQLGAFMAWLSGRYLMRTARLSNEAFQPCWYRHAVYVEIMTAVMVARVNAYVDGDGGPGFILWDWHHHVLLPAMDRVRELQIFASCTKDKHADDVKGYMAAWSSADSNFQTFLTGGELHEH